MSPLKNVPASIRQRLLNLSRQENRPFNQLLQYYAMERFLYRFSQSSYADQFILKGALLLNVWHAPGNRSTKDIDMLGNTSNSESHIRSIINEILLIEVAPDGLEFHPDSITTESIAEDADYIGTRIRFIGNLDTARVTMQIDIGFSDSVYPRPQKETYPTILDMPAPQLLCYSRETSIAEKFDAIIKLGMLNSRMKDFYDIWLLSRQFSFDPYILATAIKVTLNKRGTKLPTSIEAFDSSFSQSKQTQWTAFLKRLRLDHAPSNLADVVADIQDFLDPILREIR